MLRVERFIPLLISTGVFLFTASAQTLAPALTRIEPGLEKAVRWKWTVEPSPTASWGDTQPVTAPTPSAGFPMGIPVAPAIPLHPATAGAPGTYTVKRGDALILISRKFKVPVPLLKSANGLTNDTIRAGQTLRIPPPEEVAAQVPPPQVAGKPAGTHSKLRKPHVDSMAEADLQTLTLQVFLDRERFSAGPIDAKVSPDFLKIVQLYQTAHAEVPNSEALLQKAQTAVHDPFSHYTLRVEDFRFIAPPKAQVVSPATGATTGKHKTPPSTRVAVPKPTYDDLTTTSMLAYRSPWEFVAERFHCDEAYLRSLNPQIPNLPAAGAEFRVPNVIPFAIESVFLPPLQPRADPQAPVVAAIADLSRLEISRSGQLVAVLPLSIARPGLRGKDPWTILDAVPRPQLVTRQELRDKPVAPTRIYGRESPDATPPPVHQPLTTDQIIASGPRNPVGILWINLGKSGQPLPYGLHGTSIPDDMRSHQSLGGIRLANWDIARAVHLLPSGTPLEWKQSGPVPVAAAAARPAQ